MAERTDPAKALSVARRCPPNPERLLSRGSIRRNLEGRGDDRGQDTVLA